jgi:cyclic pyranopterin phosphate synthase
MEKTITHLDANGNAVMVDVTAKEATKRCATACGKIAMQPGTFSMLKEGAAKKGDVLGVSRIAGIMAVKRTHELIPLCHPIGITGCTVDFECDGDENVVVAKCSVQVTGSTGVEMEALVGATTALLTIYDMLKAIDRGMVIFDVYLMEKSGGKSGHFVHSPLKGRGGMSV